MGLGLMDLGVPELVIILLIVLVLFGGSRLPKLSRSIGQSMKEIRDGFTSKESPPEGDKTKDKQDEPKIKE